MTSGENWTLNKLESCLNNALNIAKKWYWFNLRDESVYWWKEKTPLYSTPKP